MIHEYNHVGILTADIEASISFYTTILNGQIVRDARSLDGKSRFVYIQLGKGIIELITTGNPAAQGFAHIAFLMEGKVLDAAYETLSSQGVEFTVLPKTAGSGDGRLAFLKAPGGIICELIEREPRPRAEQKDGLILSYLYTRLNTGNQLEACKAFLANSLDMKPLDGNRLSLGDDVVALTDQEGGIDAIVLQAADVEETREYMRKHGVRMQDMPIGFKAFAPCGAAIHFVP